MGGKSYKGNPRKGKGKPWDKTKGKPQGAPKGNPNAREANRTTTVAADSMVISAFHHGKAITALQAALRGEFVEQNVQEALELLQRATPSNGTPVKAEKPSKVNLVGTVHVFIDLCDGEIRYVGEIPVEWLGLGQFAGKDVLLTLQDGPFKKTNYLPKAMTSLTSLDGQKDRNVSYGLKTLVLSGCFKAETLTSAPKSGVEATLFDVLANAYGQLSSLYPSAFGIEEETEALEEAASSGEE
jgi:hypothetical protein